MDAGWLFHERGADVGEKAAFEQLADVLIDGLTGLVVAGGAVAGHEERGGCGQCGWIARGVGERIQGAGEQRSGHVGMGSDGITINDGASVELLAARE